MSARTLRRVADLLVCAALLWYGLVSMRPYQLRVGQFWEDDTPILYANAFKEPAKYAADYQSGLPFGDLQTLKLGTSAMNWLPAVLWRYGDLRPYAVVWLLTFVQGAGIGIALYVLARSGGADAATGMLATVITYAAIPGNWNLANYGNDGSWTFLPYPAHLALVPIFLAFAAVLRDRVALSGLGLVAAAIIHPGLALQALGIVCLDWLADLRRLTRGDLLHRAGWILACAGAAVVPPQLVIAFTAPADALSAPELMEGMRQNAHLWPWSNPSWLRASVFPTLGWISIAAIAWVGGAGQVRLRRLWLMSVAGAVILSGSHLLGAAIGNPSMLSVVGLRSWMWPAMLGVILVADLAGRQLRDGRWLVAAGAAICLSLPVAARNFGIAPVPVICLGLAVVTGFPVIRQGSWGRSISWALTAMIAIVLAAWLVLFTYWPPLTEWPDSAKMAAFGLFFHSAIASAARQLLVAAVVVVAAISAVLSQRAPQTRTAWSMYAWTGVAVAYAVGFGLVEARAAAAATQPQSSDWQTLALYDWARNQSPADALFVVTRPGWRTLAERRRLDPFTRESYAYFAPRGADRWRRRLLGFYGIERSDARGPVIVKRQIAAFRTFGEADFVRFAAEFGATHVVIPTCYPETDRTRFDLPLDYENACYRVYAISPARLAAERAAAVARSEPPAARRDWNCSRDDALLTVVPASALRASGEGCVVRFDPTTRVMAAPDALTLERGSLVITARLRDAARPYADLIRVNDDNSLYVYYTPGAVQAFYAGGALGSARVAADNNWHHYVFTWQAGAQAFYVDGQRVLSASRTAPVGPVRQIAIGWLGTRDGEQWAGDIAQVATYDGPLTPEQVRTLFTRRSAQ